MCHHYVTSLKVMWHHIKVAIGKYIPTVVCLHYNVHCMHNHIQNSYTWFAQVWTQDLSMETSQCLCHQVTQPFVTKSLHLCTLFS
jgi:hypothetical protein